MSNIVFDTDLFKARIFHGLKSLLSKGETLPPQFLELASCQAFGVEHVGKSNYYADGFRGDNQLSVKTRSLVPICLKRKLSRDFQTDPMQFLGPHHTPKHDKWTAGIEIVQRRQQLDFKNDSTENAKKVGTQCLKGFYDNVVESYKKYNTSVSHEVVAIHGYNRTKSSYIVSLFWQEYKMLDASTITWVREGPGVSGYLDIDGNSMKVCERINGNAKREATCFKEYKDLTKYEHSATIKLPIPDPWLFEQTAIMAEINSLQEPEYESPFPFAE